MNLITLTGNILLFDTCQEKRVQKMELLHMMTNYLSLSLIRVKNSSRDLGSSLRAPNMQLVTVLLPGFCTPRMTIHICLEKKLLKQTWPFNKSTHNGNVINLLTVINIVQDCKGQKLTWLPWMLTSYNISEWY